MRLWLIDPRWVFRPTNFSQVPLVYRSAMLPQVISSQSVYVMPVVYATLHTSWSRFSTIDNTEDEIS